MFAKLGPDTGYDCISNYTPSDQLADFLNSIQETCGLPKTILYSLNPIDNTMIDTVMGCFQEAPTAGKIQNGSAWWFNDNEVGMREQLTALANEGVWATLWACLPIPAPSCPIRATSISVACCVA